MGNFIKTENSFKFGEVSNEFYHKDGLNALSAMVNLNVLPSGSLSRRYGLRKVKDLKQEVKLIPFSVSNNENYLIMIGEKTLLMHQENEPNIVLKSPWALKDLDKLQYAQRFDSMIFVHPDYKPVVLEMDNHLGGFKIRDFAFKLESNMDRRIPFMRFEDTEDVQISVDKSDRGNNFSIFTANKDIWKKDCEGDRLFVLDKQWEIREYIADNKLLVYVNGGYILPDKPVLNWKETAFGNRRGWPCSITFHQDRLVFGGSKSWPGGVWLSKIGQHRDFNPGTGLDDEAIFITLLSEQRQQISTVVSSDNLQILTSDGEWAIANKPLTPSAVDIKQHTSVGSFTNRYLAPQKIEGSTVFISSSLKDIRELSLDELGERYNANDLSALSKHLMNNPIDIAYNPSEKRLYILMQDGSLSVLNQNSALGISAWGTYKTNGKIKSISVLDDITYVVTDRKNGSFLECFDSDCLKDCEDYDFSFKASSLPFTASNHSPEKLRIRKTTVRVLDTKSLFINDKRAALPNVVQEEDSKGYTGSISQSSLGTISDTSEKLWTISGSEPLPATILSVTTNGWYKI